MLIYQAFPTYQTQRQKKLLRQAVLHTAHKQTTDWLVSINSRHDVIISLSQDVSADGAVGGDVVAMETDATDKQACFILFRKFVKEASYVAHTTNATVINAPDL